MTRVKRCPHCKKEFPATREYFSQDKSTKSGVSSWCKICKNESSKKWYALQYKTSLSFKKKRQELSKRCHKNQYTTNIKRKEYCKAQYYKRKKGYGWDKIKENIIDEPVIAHHINDNEIIYVPQDIHILYPTYPKENHRFMVNQVIEQIYNIKINKELRL